MDSRDYPIGKRNLRKNIIIFLINEKLLSSQESKKEKKIYENKIRKMTFSSLALHKISGVHR